MEFDELVVKESPGLCRCCLSEGCYKDLGSEYTWMSETEVYADMLLECFDISITQHTEGPNGPSRLICEVCITRLRDACNFKKQVLDSEKKFVDMVGRGEFGQKVMIYQTSMRLEGDGTEAGEVEYLDDDMHFDDADDEPLRPPTESTQAVPEPSASDEIIISTLKVKGKRGRPRKVVTDKVEKKPKLSRTEDKPMTSKAVKAVKDIGRNGANRFRRRNLQILFNNTTMIPFKWRGKYLCFYCGTDIDKYDDLRKHTKSHGPCNEADRAVQLVKAGDAEVKVDVSEITCEICEETFPNFEEIVSHLIFKHNQPYNKEVEMAITVYRLVDLQCLRCEESFDFLTKLITHMNSKHPDNCFQCDRCELKFNKKRDLQAHVRAYHKIEYKCGKCPLAFKTSAALQSHRGNSHSSICNFCFKTFSSVTKRLKHMNEEHDFDGVLQCGLCLKILQTKQAFLRHSAKCNLSNEDCKTNPENTKNTSFVKQLRSSIAHLINTSTAVPFKHFMNRFRCFYCPVDFTDCEELKRHTAVEHPVCDTKLKCMRLRNRKEESIKIDISSLSCKICMETLQDFDSLVTHLITEHKGKLDKNMTQFFQPFKLIKDNYPCPYCNDRFNYFTTLLKHVSKDHTDNRIICLYCGMSFRTDPNLRAHMTRHHKAAKYKCTPCDRYFSSNNDLQLHLGTKHGVKCVECPHCPEKFTSRYSVQRHQVNTHSIGHKCDVCGKLFTRHSFMMNHMRRLHFKEKNVQCSVCSEKFFDGQRLKMHMVKHIGERNFHCDICGKKFLWKKNLRGHMSSHIKRSNVLQNLTD